MLSVFCRHFVVILSSFCCHFVAFILVYPHGWVDNNGANDWESWTTYLQDKENTVWEATLNIATATNGEKISYDIFPIEKVEAAQTMGTSSTNNNISQPKPIVNTNLKNSDRVFSEEAFSEKQNISFTRAYNLKAIKIELAGGQLGNNSSSSRPDTSSINSISGLYEFVKTLLLCLTKNEVWFYNRFI